MIEFASHISGVPCLIRGTFHAGCPATMDDPGESDEFIFDIFTPEGDPDPRLWDDVDRDTEGRIYTEAVQLMENMSTDMALFYRI